MSSKCIPRFEPCAVAELSVEEAYMVLEPYYLSAQVIFIEYCQELQLGPEIKKTQLECRPEMHDGGRHFAGTTLDGKLVCVAPELAELPEGTVAAIFAHELGHAVDHLHPGRFFWDGEELVFVKDSIGEDPRQQQARVARMKRWESRSEDEIELVADLIAEQATGNRIGYTGPCLLQDLNRGVRRPKGLR